MQKDSTFDEVKPKRRSGARVKPKPVNEEFIDRVYRVFEEFRSAYVPEWQRQDNNERLYRGDHWDAVPMLDPSEPRPVTPIINSTVENIQADLMDRSPIAVVRPENPEDRDIAEIVNSLIRQNHDAQNFRREYRKICHDLLVQGWCVQETGYDVHAYHDIGMAFIRYIDCRSILFDPQAEDIQDGRAVFKIAPITIDRLEQMYPQYAGLFQKDSYAMSFQADPKLRFDQEKSVLQLEYWWREYDAKAGVWRVHMAKIAGHQVLEDSRTVKPEGYFSVGEYPFKVTTLFRCKGSPLGWGIADMFGRMQEYSDKLDQITHKNALMASHNKLLVTEQSGFDVADLQDWSKEVHRGTSVEGVKWFETPPLPPYLVGLPEAIRESLREESGANDFSRGSTAAGVTAASAIAALQDMSSKRSRMISDQLHESFRESVRYEIEFEREFNILPREVLVMRDGEQVPRTFTSAMLERAQGDVALPIEFYVSIKVETESRWSTQAHNELMLQLAGAGAIPVQQLVEFMIFDGKDEVLAKLRQQASGAQEQLIQAMAEQQAMEQQLPPEQAVPPEAGAIAL